MAEIPKTPVMLITGSLGSGKTTLLRRILDYAHFRIAVLMNEFGELAVDSRVISGKNIDIIELVGGCVCCSMTGEFEAAIGEIIETIGPDFIVVEATGLAESDALVFEVEDNLSQVRLDSVVCIVDACLGIRYPYVGYTSRTQIASADIILINKVDLVRPAEAETVEARLRKYNDRAVFLRTENCRVDTNLLFGQTSRHSALSPLQPPAQRGAGPAVETLAEAPQAPSKTAPILAAVSLPPAAILQAGNSAGGPTAPAPPHSFTWTTEKTLDSSKFDGLVRELPEDLIRAKGFVRFEDGGRLFNYVAGRADFEEFNVERTELVFIGHNLDRLRLEIENRLHDCEAG